MPKEEVTISAEEYASLLRDRDRLNFIDGLAGDYTGRMALRMSSSGRGFRLHETSREDGLPSVREAIDAAIKDGVAKE